MNSPLDLPMHSPLKRRGARHACTRFVRATALAAAVLAALPSTALAAAEEVTPAPDAPAAAPAPAPAQAATPGKAASNPDPLEKVNRATYAFNDALDRMLARPAAKAYRRVVPEPGRTAISNFVSNLEYPTTVLNSALQGKFKEAGQGTARFVVNATVGLAGLMDPATKMGLPRIDEDFGQTLGKWGVPSGPYLVLPGFGPSTLRDGPSRFVDRYTNARHYIGNGSTEWVLLGVDLVDTRAQLLAADVALESAFDPYALVRNAYLQRREYLVRDGVMPEEDYDDLYEEPLEDDVPPGDDTAAPETAPQTGPAGTAETAPTPAPQVAPEAPPAEPEAPPAEPEAAPAAPPQD
jgi:phospholipid-binding lipoprotein MlaA